MKSCMLQLVMVGCVILVISSFGLADIVQIAPDADTYIVKSSPDTNYGSEDILWVRDDGANDVKKTLIHFPLDALSGISADDITSATLNFYAYNWGARPWHDVCRLGTSWTETEATWNNANDFQEVYDSFWPSQEWKWYSTDITELVKKWLNGTYSNYGVGIQFQYANQYKNTQIHSRENADNQPYLSVEYVPEPATIGLMLLGLVSLIRKR